MLNSQRVKTLQNGFYQGQSVLYWMNRDKRAKDNWALIEAQKFAIEKKAPLIVCFQYFGKFKEANIRQYSFLLKGLLELSNDLKSLNINFYLIQDTKLQLHNYYLLYLDQMMLLTLYLRGLKSCQLFSILKSSDLFR